MTQAAFQPIRDLAPVDAPSSDNSTEDSTWDSTGDDPGFLIPLGFFRRPFMLIALESHGAPLDPRLYLNYGAGFSENDAVAPEPGIRHLLRIDVGTIGTLRALRLDPASFPVRFSWRIESFASREAADRRTQEYRANMPDARFQHLARLNRIRLPGLRLRSPFGAPAVADHANYLYALAGRETAALAFAPAGTWLSIVVPVYNAPKRYLDDLLAAFRSQDIAGTELILSDDGSTLPETLKWLEAARGAPCVKIVFNAENGGIAASTNAGLGQAEGRWVALLDHDDVVAPHALKLIRLALEAHPDTAFLYTDEMVVDDRLKPTGYMLKPAYDPVLLTGVNYINHFSLYRRDRLEAVGRLRQGFDGSQDYDLLLRYLADLPEAAVLHLPYPAYWWRRTGQTYSRKFLDKATANARKALSDSLRAKGMDARIGGALTDTLHRIDFAGAAKPPKISIIIPNRNGLPLITRILADLYTRTDYPDFEVLVIDNGTTDAAVLALYEKMRAEHPNFAAHIKPEPFNFSRAINRGMALSTGEHVLLLNNDIEVIEPGWLTEMVSCLSYERAGIVGAKLLYPDGTLQHAGVIAGFGGLAGHWYLGKPRDYGGPMNRLHVRASMSCVTGAAMLVSGACRQAVGDLDEKNFAVAYNDVDYCLRAYGKGFRTVWTPFACLYHHESATRGSEKTLANRARFEAEKANLRRIHGTTAFLDPAASPLQSRNHSTPGLHRPDRLPAARTWFAGGS